MYCCELISPSLSPPLTLTDSSKQDEIFTSAYATAAYLKTILKFPEDKKVYVIGEKGLEDELDSVGIKRCGGTVSID